MSKVLELCVKFGTDECKYIERYCCLAGYKPKGVCPALIEIAGSVVNLALRGAEVMSEQISFEEARRLSIKKWEAILDNLSDLGTEFHTDCGFCMRHVSVGCDLCEAYGICKGKGSELSQAWELFGGLEEAVENLIDALKRLEK